MKTFLNSFWNFVFCLKFHPQQFSPNGNFKNSLSNRYATLFANLISILVNESMYFNYDSDFIFFI